MDDSEPRAHPVFRNSRMPFTELEPLIHVHSPCWAKEMECKSSRIKKGGKKFLIENIVNAFFKDGSETTTL
jgi:hypothetical protein